MDFLFISIDLLLLDMRIMGAERRKETQKIDQPLMVDKDIPYLLLFWSESHTYAKA